MELYVTWDQFCGIKDLEHKCSIEYYPNFDERGWIKGLEKILGLSTVEAYKNKGPVKIIAQYL